MRNSTLSCAMSSNASVVCVKKSLHHQMSRSSPRLLDCPICKSLTFVSITRGVSWKTRIKYCGQKRKILGETHIEFCSS